MASVIINLPMMFADHHVLRVRDALYVLDGVEDVYASSAWQSVIVSFDTDKIDSDAIELALINAGYTPDQPSPILASLVGNQFKDPAWAAIGPRVTRRDAIDAKMSKIG